MEPPVHGPTQNLRLGAGLGINSSAAAMSLCRVTLDTDPAALSTILTTVTQLTAQGKQCNVLSIKSSPKKREESKFKAVSASVGVSLKESNLPTTCLGKRVFESDDDSDDLWSDGDPEDSYLSESELEPLLSPVEAGDVDMDLDSVSSVVPSLSLDPKLSTKPTPQ